MFFKPVQRVFSLFAASFALLGALLVSVSAQADIDPGEGLPETVTADGLPTVQINGVVWDQVIVGDTVYAAGQFTSARPAGAAPGVNETPRNNLVAYSLTTGEMISSWAPSANAQVKSITTNDDGSIIYVAGSFTQINGQNRYRLAAIDAVTGQLRTNIVTGFDATVNAVHWTPEALYVGGHFSKAGSTPRVRIAAISPANGAVLPFEPTVPDHNVQAITTSPDNSKVVIGGSFTSVNGQNKPGLGLAMLDAATGKTNLPLSANNFIRNGGLNAGILELSADNDGFYGVGFVSGKKVGTTEGSFAADWNGDLIWVEDCHGDSYDIIPVDDVVYVASHKHYCSNLGTGGFPQTDPWPYYRGTAHTKAATGISQKDIFPSNYLDQEGQPSNTLLNWFPDLNAGTHTGQNQGPWDVDAAKDYVVMGGEFTRVNNVPQQGLVRFATKEIAPQKQGPLKLDDKPLEATVRPVAAGVNRITWPAMWDKDNASITYKVFREDMNTEVFRKTQTARFWEARGMGFTDRGLTPGASVRYRVQASDSSGNVVNSPWVTVTVSSTGTLSNYANTVLDAEPLKYWRLGETGRTLLDWGGVDDTQTGSGAARGVAGAINGDSNQATNFKGGASSVAFSRELIQAPDEFSLEGWFKTSATGKIVGFGNNPSGDSADNDRTVHIDSNGRLTFGLHPASLSAEATIQSTTNVRDNQWHHFVATLDSKGMALFLDGKKVAARSDVTRGQNIFGYWRIGGDRTWSGNKYFNGHIDEFAIYPRALTPTEVNDHWTASGRASNLPSKPSDAYGASVFDDNPDFFWRLNETSGSVANDTSWSGHNATFAGERDYGRAGIMPGSTAINLRVPKPGGFLGIGKKDGGNINSDRTVANPNNFTQEVWLKTTATKGGRIMGFGTSSNAALSSSYDRHLQLLDNGRVMFGVYPGVAETITSTKAVNDGQWHHLVSSLGPDGGMRLYVDGKLEASNPNVTTGQNYVGRWKVGGDKVWDGSSDQYLAGEFDEVALYPRELALGEVQDHYAASGRENYNTPPVSSFTFTTNNLKADFDSSASTDAEGPITRVWNFGDGATSTAVKPSHTYGGAGTYTVTLTVTDSSGSTHVSTKDVTVHGANSAPVASFSHKVTGLDVAFTSSSTDPDGTIVSYAWDFGDGATSTAQNPTHTYANGVVRTVTLTVTDDRGATNTTTAQVDPDALPTVDFTHTSNAKRAAFTAAAFDDGSITSYVWNFGDGSTSIQANPIHDYADFGTYTVTLTVQDNTGNVVSRTHQVTVEPAPNQAPTAQFVYSIQGTDVSFDGSGSHDPEGPVTKYEWNFGDGATATGATAAHTYAASGDYTVTLKVTDADGAVDQQSRVVSIVIPTAGQQWVKDDFERNQVNSWGTADTGGTWLLTGPASQFRVSNGAGQVELAAGREGKARLDDVQSDESDAVFDYRFDKSITGSGSTWLDFLGRQVDTNNSYRSRVVTGTNGAVRLDITRVLGGTSSTLASVTVPGMTMQGGETLRVRTKVTGTSPTEIKVKVWKVGTPEPEAWNLERTDNTASLQTEGGIGFNFYLSAGVTNAPQVFTIDNLSVKTEGVLAVNQDPIAAFTSSENDGVLSVDASGSIDPDGTIASYAWNFGDGSTATGVTAQHTYAATGTYPVSLTVTDAEGASNTLTKSISVTVPNTDPEPEPEPEPEPVEGFAADDFNRAVSNGWGTAVLGGPWSITGGSAAPFQVANNTGKVTLAAGGGRTAWLNEVSSDDTDLTFEYSLSRSTAGTSGSIIDVIPRAISANDNYHSRIVVQGDGKVRVELARTISGTKTSLGMANVAGLTVAPNQTLKVRIQAVGTGTTNLRAKVWSANDVEPEAWTIVRSDNTSTMQRKGVVGLFFYLSAAAGAGNQVFTVDNVAATPVK